METENPRIRPRRRVLARSPPALRVYMYRYATTRLPHTGLSRPVGDLLGAFGRHCSAGGSVQPTSALESDDRTRTVSDPRLAGRVSLHDEEDHNQYEQSPHDPFRPPSEIGRL